MVDELYDRTYQTARGDLNKALSTVFSGLTSKLSESFKVLHKIEWSAPWAAPKKSARRV